MTDVDQDGHASASTSPDPSQQDAGETSLGANYWRLMASSGISNLGDGIDEVALPLLAAAITRDPLAFAGVAVAGRLPWLVFALQAGAIADRVDRRLLMAAMQVVRFVLMMTVGFAALGGWATMPLLYVVAFAGGIAETLYDNSSQAFLPSIVARENLERANGRLFSVEWTANQFIGPPIGGLLFAVSMSLPMFVDAATFAVSGFLLLGIVPAAGKAAAGVAAATGDGDEDAPKAPRPSLLADIKEGLAWLWQHRLLRTLGILLGVMNGVGAMCFATLALFATGPDSILQLDERGFGLLLTAAGFGSILAGLVADRVVQRLGRGVALWATLIGSVGITLLWGLTSSWLVFAAASAAYSIVGTIWNVITVSLRQTIIPDHLLGRVNSVYRFLGWGSMPIGAFVGGVVASAWGLRAPYLVGAVLLALPLVPAIPILTTKAIEDARAAAG